MVRSIFGPAQISEQLKVFFDKAYRKYFIVSRAYSNFLRFFCGFTFK